MKKIEVKTECETELQLMAKAYSGNDEVGIIEASLMPDTKYAILTTWEVCEEYSLKGIGRRLMKKMKKLARKHGMKKIYVHACGPGRLIYGERNPMSVEEVKMCYRKVGYEDFELMKCFNMKLELKMFNKICGGFKNAKK